MSASASNWWDLLKQLFGMSRNDLDGVDGLSLTPEDYQRLYMDDIKETYSASLESSPFAQRYGMNNLKFYVVNDDGTLELVNNSNITVVVRRYNDNQVGIVFFDARNNHIVSPEGLNLGDNVTPSDRQIGEYTIAPPKTNVTPSDIASNVNKPNQAIQYFTDNTSVDLPTPTPPTPDPPSPTTPSTQKNYNTSQFAGKLLFRYNDARGSAFLYEGAVVVTQYQLPDGGYALIFSKPNGERLTPDSSISQASPDINTFRRIETINGEQRRVVYISAGGNTGFQWLEDNYSGSPPTPEPPPEPPVPSGFTRIEGNTTTSGWKFLRLLNEDGTTYTGQYYIEYKQRRFRGRLGAQIQDVTFYTLDSNGNKQYIKADFGDVNWGMGGDSTNPIFDENGNIVGEQYNFTLPNDSRGSLEDFLNQYYDTDRGLYPDDPPPPEPPAPSGEQILGTIESEDFVGLIFSNGQNPHYRGDVTAKWLGDTDGDGKNEIVFLDEDGNTLELEVADGYEADVPAEDTNPNRRRLQEDDDDAWTYETTESLDRFREEFLRGFDVQHDAPIIPIADEGYTIQGFILYNDTQETFGIDEPSYEPDITQSAILGFCNWNGDHEKDEKTRKAKLFGFSDADFGDDDDMFGDDDAEQDDNMFGDDDEGATEEPTMGQDFSEGGEEFKQQPELFASPPDYCDVGSGRGRRLQACAPNETGDPPSNSRTEHRERITGQQVSQMDLLNLEYNRAHEDDPKHGFFEGEGSADHKIEYDTVKETTDERELVSMFATFADASYVDDTKRPTNLFGMKYRPEESSNNFALYTAPANREAVISIRGTKPSNITDLMSDALILTGYQDTLSIRFDEDLRKVKALMDKYPDTQFTLSGHSLSGAINSYIINELKGTKYEDRLKAVSFNSGRAPNTKSERSGQIKELITDVSIVKALKEGDPRYLPIMSSIQRTLNINASDLAGGNLGTLSESQLAQYPELSSSYQQMLGSLRNAETLAERQSIAEGWIESNRAFLEGGVDVAGSITNLIKTKIYLDLAIAMFDWSANYGYDQIYRRESDLDARMKNTRNPYEQMFQDGNNAIFKYNSDPISVHHSLIDNDERNVRTYFQEDEGEERPSLLEEGLIGQLSYGLKSHGISNFMTDKDKARVDHSETLWESFTNILDDNVESLSGVLNGIGRKGRKELEEFLSGIF